MTARRPPAVARAAVALAVAALRTAEDRARYRAEFLAELSDLRPGQQLRYGAGLLATTFALRAALNVAVAPASSWRCRLLRWHTWVRRSTEDGFRYQQCARCGRDRGPVGYGPLTTPPYGTTDRLLK